MSKIEKTWPEIEEIDWLTYGVEAYFVEDAEFDNGFRTCPSCKGEVYQNQDTQECATCDGCGEIQWAEAHEKQRDRIKKEALREEKALKIVKKQHQDRIFHREGKEKKLVKGQYAGVVFKYHEDTEAEIVNSKKLHLHKCETCDNCVKVQKLTGTERQTTPAEKLRTKFFKEIAIIEYNYKSKIRIHPDQEKLLEEKIDRINKLKTFCENIEDAETWIVLQRFFVNSYLGKI